MGTPEFDTRFSVRCTTAMKALIEERAREEGITLSEYVREHMWDHIHETVTGPK